MFYLKGKKAGKRARSYSELLGKKVVTLIEDCKAFFIGVTFENTTVKEPVCVDCGKGTPVWAEAGYVPWYRICDVCGSRWEQKDHEITVAECDNKEPWFSEFEKLIPNKNCRCTVSVYRRAVHDNMRR